MQQTGYQIPRPPSQVGDIYWVPAKPGGYWMGEVVEITKKAAKVKYWVRDEPRYRWMPRRQK